MICLILNRRGTLFVPNNLPFRQRTIEPLTILPLKKETPNHPFGTLQAAYHLRTKSSSSLFDIGDLSSNFHHMANSDLSSKPGNIQAHKNNMRNST